VPTKTDVAQVIRVSRVFGDTRKERHWSLTSTDPICILAIGVSRCDNNFSVFCELTLAFVVQKLSEILENCPIVLSKLGFSPNSEKVA
jgi:hypothetical protein